MDFKFKSSVSDVISVTALYDRIFRSFRAVNFFLIVAILIITRHQPGVICQLQIHILDDESDQCYIQKVVYYI